MTRFLLVFQCVCWFQKTDSCCFMSPNALFFLKKWTFFKKSIKKCKLFGRYFAFFCRVTDKNIYFCTFPERKLQHIGSRPAAGQKVISPCYRQNTYLLRSSITGNCSLTT